jgi:glycosyltransferase involved in cell wall biosynthesis
MLAQGFDKSILTARIPGYLEDDQFFPDPPEREFYEKYDIPHSTETLLTVCRFDPNERDKGYDLILEALPLLVQDFPELCYLLVGKGPDLTRLQAKVTDLKLENHVRFCGFVPSNDLRNFYSLASAFCMPSSKEGQGLVYLEALACGTPVLVGSNDAGVEVLFSEDAGIAVNPSNQEEIDHALRALLARPRPGETSRNSLHQSAKKAFDASTFCESWATLIRDHI